MIQKIFAVLIMFTLTTQALFAESEASMAAYYKKMEAKRKAENKKRAAENKKKLADDTNVILKLGVQTLELNHTNKPMDANFATVSLQYLSAHGIKQGVSFGAGYELGYEVDNETLLHAVDVFMNIAVHNGYGFYLGYYTGYTDMSIYNGSSSDVLLLSGPEINFHGPIELNIIGFGLSIRYLEYSTLNGVKLNHPEDYPNVAVKLELILPY